MRLRLRHLFTLSALGCATPPEPALPEPSRDVVAVAPQPRTSVRSFAASEIRVAWRGAEQAPDSVTRGDLEAKGIADRVYARLKQDGEFEAIARVVSDAPTGRRGGAIGAFVPGTLDPTFETAVRNLEVGEISAPFRTPFGWHVVRRDPIDEVHIAMILVASQGASSLQRVRTAAAARARAETLLDRLAAGEDFGEVAKRFSDDPSKVRGGDIGFIGRGQMVPAFEDAAFALEPGERSAIVETPYGVHILHRIE